MCRCYASLGRRGSPGPRPAASLGLPRRPAAVEHCVKATIEPLLAAGRDGHHPHWEDRFTEPPPLAEPASAVDRMKHRLKTIQGRKLYGLRKQTVEPVFGIMAQGQWLAYGVALG